MSTTAPKDLTPEEIDAVSKKMGGGDKVKRKPDDFPNVASVPHAVLAPVFDDTTNNLWTVEGSFSLIPFVFALTSTMTIYRNDSGELVIFNALRASEKIEQEILKLGPIAHVVKLGQFHGDADAYYVRAPQFQNGGKAPKLWTLPGGSVAEGTTADEILSDTNLPIPGARLYNLKGHMFPEGLMTVPSAKNGPVLIACDALIHVTQMSAISYGGRLLFYLMGWNMQSAENVPKPAPLWCQRTVEALGADCVKGWYKDIAAMEWKGFVGAHGGSARNCNDHGAMMKEVEAQLAKIGE